MNYAELIKLLENASAFDLYRLQSVLDEMIDDPRRIMEVKLPLRLGQKIQYFDRAEASLQEAIVERIKQTRAVVRNCSDNRRWDIPLAAINIRGDDVPAPAAQKPRPGNKDHKLCIGDPVSFVDQTGREHIGTVIRLNKKTVTIAENDDDEGTWRVSYALVNRVIEAQT